MIKDRDHKIEQIITTIKTDIQDINERYRSGPDLYFYKRLNHLRNGSKSIEAFLRDDYNIEILYATLVAWDMNSRSAKMKYFSDFKSNILSCLDHFKELEGFEDKLNLNLEKLVSSLKSTYERLDLMKTKGKLVSNSKLLHFLFPKILVPMDRNNTLFYFYGNTNESVNKYVEITELSFEILNMSESWEKFLDNGWNTSIPKMIDNAVILLVGKSVKAK